MSYFPLPLPLPLPLPRPDPVGGRPPVPHKLFFTTPSSPSSPIPNGVGDDGLEESIESVDSIVSDLGIGSLSREVWPGRGEGDVGA